MKTIKSSREIDYLFKSGKRLHNPYITFIVSTSYPQTFFPQGSLVLRRNSETNEPFIISQSKNETSNDYFGRVAFIAGKKHGSAVWRNCAKRRMRAICHDLGGPWKEFNIIFLANKPILKASYSKVTESCRKTLAFLWR